MSKKLTIADLAALIEKQQAQIDALNARLDRAAKYAKGLEAEIKALNARLDAAGRYVKKQLNAA